MHGGDDKEYERRFLVEDLSFAGEGTGNEVEQGYLFSEGGWALRVRRTRVPDSAGVYHDAPALLTLKGPRIGSARVEYEWPIPDVAHAAALIQLAPTRIRKTRLQVVSEGNLWDVDVFHDENEGLVIAECEGTATLVQRLRKPWWAVCEITDDLRYNNENLAARPWPTWGGSDEERKDHANS